MLAITSGVEPKSYQEAIEDENWRYAVKDEIDALEENGTWTVETLPAGKKPIGCKWFFRLKFNSDGTLERHKARITRLHVLVYVDDLIITGTSIHIVNEFKHYLSSCFHMKNLGPLRYFLGIEVARSPTGMYLCQRKYALDISSETCLMGVKPTTFPLEQNHKLSLAQDGSFSDPTRYRRLVGRLIYLGNTRPELSYVIHILSQFMNDPQNAHWNAALRVVRYDKNSPGQGILLRANTPLTLTAWCDSDHGACPITSRSLTGWFIQFGDSPLSWKTKKHDVVSRSSAEAEYRGMADTVSEILWLCELLPTLGIKVNTPITLHSDSLSAIMLAAIRCFMLAPNMSDVMFISFVMRLFVGS